jgi:hypothetical protein
MGVAAHPFDMRSSRSRLTSNWLRKSWIRLYVQMVDSWIAGASGDPERGEAALVAMQPVLEEAGRGGAVRPQLWARYAIARIELYLHRPDARAHLRALRKDAQALGFGLIARRAESAVR